MQPSLVIPDMWQGIQCGRDQLVYTPCHRLVECHLQGLTDGKNNLQAQMDYIRKPVDTYVVVSLGCPHF